MSKVLYSIGVKVYPDTRGFAAKTRRFLERTEDKLVLIPKLDLSEGVKASFKAKYRAFLDKLNGDRDYALSPRVDFSVPRGALERIRHQVEGLDPEVDIHLQTGRGFKRDLERLRHAIKGHDNFLTLDIGVDPAEVERRVNEVVRELREMDKDFTSVLNVDLDKGVAELKLKALTRPREAVIKPVVNPGAYLLADATLKRLTGFRFAQDFTRNTWDFLKDLDKHAPKIAGLALGVGALASAVGKVTAGTVTFGAAVAKLGSFSLLAPGFLASAAIGVGTLVVAFKDADKYVGNLGKRFTVLRETVGSNFWRDIVGPLNEVADDLLPKLNTHLRESSRLLGANFLKMFQGIRSALSDGVVDSLFFNLNKSIEALAPGVESLTKAVTGLGVRGAPHLVTFNKWVSKVLTTFSQWVEVSGKTGKFDQWIIDATESAKQFGRTMRETGGFLRGLNRAAKDAGSNGLATLERTMGRLNRMVNSLSGQSFLKDYFTASSVAWESATVGFSNFAKAISDRREVLTSSLRSVGEAFKFLLTGVGNVVRNPVFARGVTTLFSGVSETFKVLSAHGDSIGRVLGSVGTIAGNMLPVLAEWVGLLADTFAPALESLASASKGWDDALRAIANSGFVKWLSAAIGGLGQLSPLVAAAAVGFGALRLKVKALELVQLSRDFFGLSRAVKSVPNVADAVAPKGATSRVRGMFTALRGIGPVGGVLVSFAAAVGTAGLVKGLHDYAKGIDATAKSYAELKNVVETKGSSPYALDEYIRSWKDNGVFSLVTGNIRDLKGALQTLREEDTYLSQFLQNPFWTGIDLTANNVSVLKENVAGLDKVFAEMAHTNLPAFNVAWGNAVGKFDAVELDGILEKMPQLKEQLDNIATNMGVTTDSANRFKIASGELTTKTNQWGQQIVTRLTPAQRELSRAWDKARERISLLVNQSPALMTAMDNIAQKLELPLSPAEKLKILSGELRIAFDQDGKAIVQSVTDTSKSIEENHAAVKEQQKALLEQFPELRGEWEKYAKAIGLVPSEMQKLASGEIDVYFDTAKGVIKSTQTAFNDFFAGVTKGKTGYVEAIDGMEGVTANGFDRIFHTSVTHGARMATESERLKIAMLWENNETFRGMVNAYSTGLDTIRARLVAHIPLVVGASALMGDGVKNSLSINAYMSGYTVGSTFANGLFASRSLAERAAGSLASAVRAFFPNSPAKRGPFSGKGWVSHSGESVGRAWAEGIARSARFPEREAERLAERTRNAIRQDTFGGNSTVNHSAVAFTGPRTMVLKVGEREFTAYVDSRAETVVAGGSRERVREMSGLY